MRKHVPKYTNMPKSVVEFPRKLENRGIKIARVNSIITKSIDLDLFTLILKGAGGSLRSKTILALSPFIEKSMANRFFMFYKKKS